jgi:hypothetical protein
MVGDALALEVAVLRWSSRARSLPEALFLELLEQEIHGTFDDERQVAVRVRMAHEVLRAFELLAELVARSELHLVACLRERHQLRPGRCHGS